ncbi:hypothetical protein [Sulfurovum sp.]|jgi:hypothetical protein|uniref:hypothetical protein n=1 Tax=Sulfurovum sp. TaxID=1969726 RepID=UPI002A36573A|nr:hypothetical protein [Sulfurovum sp.]MDD2451246.1 hypothetical protein [Sulfurovum sp.]MDY0403434.1 hypothetical protein [Sulfurovum sp.]
MEWEKVALLLIGGIVGFLVNVILMRVKNKDEFRKERLKNLYYPLQAIIDKRYKTVRLMKHHFSKDFESFAIAYYKFFLALRDTYLDNRVYASMELVGAFNRVLHNHEMESLNYSHRISNEDELLKRLALFELKHKINEDGLSEMERNLEKVLEVIYTDIEKLSSAS